MEFKEFLELVVKRYKSRNNKEVKQYQFAGSGNYAVVFDLGDGVVYKASTEMKYNKLLESSTIINNLHNKGVNVPAIYSIERFDDNSSKLQLLRFRVSGNKKLNHKEFVKEVKYCLDNDRGEEFYSTLKHFCGILQDKVNGEVCFKRVLEGYEHLCDLPESVLRNIKNVNKSLQKKYVLVQNAIENKLDFFLNIPTEHYAKFIADGLKVVNANISIDNITKSNFMYDPDKGFYYIDLDAFEPLIDEKNKEKWDDVFDCTINNIFSQLEYPKRFYIEDSTKEKFIQLVAKTYEALKEAYLENIDDKFISQGIKSFTRQIGEWYFFDYFKTFATQDKLKKKVRKYINICQDCEGIIRGTVLTCEK